MRERGENPDQMVQINGRAEPVSELATTAGTKTLLMSLATEMAVQNALDTEGGESKPAVVSKRKVEMSL